MDIKILILSTSLGFGGADNEIISLSSHLVSRGYQVKIVSMVSLGVMGLEAQSQGLDVSSFNISPGFPDIRVIPKLISLIKDWQPHILHSHMVHANLLARIVRSLVNIPVLISTAHSVDESNGEMWREIAYRATDSFCDLTTNVSKLGVERYINIGLVPKHKAIFIPTSVDITKFHPCLKLRNHIRQELELEERFIWLAVGRFDPPKDYLNMIQAFALTVKKKPDILLLIAGEGQLKIEIENLVKTLGIESNIQFLGCRRDVSALMNAVDAYLMSSAWEGMPLVLLEAAATELPIVATDVGGIPEIVLHGETGILVPSKNPEALSVAMQQLMEMPREKRLEMGKIARKSVVAKYSTAEIVSQWEQVYLEMLGKLEGKL